jgi:hypothetical protein
MIRCRLALVGTAIVFLPALTSAEVNPVEVDLSNMQNTIPPGEFHDLAYRTCQEPSSIPGPSRAQGPL